MNKTPHYLNDKICLNVLANSLENAKEIYEAAEGHVLVGLLSKNYETVEAAIKDMKTYAETIDNTRALLGQDETIVNGLISPSGTAGLVKVSTGPLSSLDKPALVPVKTAIDMLKDMGCSSVKFFPMKGLSTKEEYRVVCEACAAEDFMMEPTGGIDLTNFEEICRIALEAGVKRIIPHVYTSIVDKETGETKREDIQTLLEIMKRL